MLITEVIEINASEEQIWNNLRTLEGAENYIPMVTKSSVEGDGIGAKRICDIQMGDQSFQITEKLEKIDEQQKSLTISIQSAPPPFQGNQITFSITGEEVDKTRVAISSDVNEKSSKMIMETLSMIVLGLKKFHEK